MSRFQWSKYLGEVANPNEKRGGIEYQLTLCPHCGETDKKVSARLDWGTYHCYRCGGWFTPAQVVGAYENLSGRALQSRVNQFQKLIAPTAPTIEDALESLRKKQEGESETVTPIVPPIVSPLNQTAADYLRGRGFDRNVAEYFRLGWCEFGRYAHRIFIPVFYKRELVAFQARSIYPKIKQRYLFPKGNKAQRYLYNADSATGGWGVLVEGVTDAWAIFMHATHNVVAGFGKELTGYQLSKVLSLGWSELFIMLDGDAIKSALRVARSLYGVMPIRIALFDHGEDPASAPHLIGKALDQSVVYEPGKEARLIFQAHQ